MSVVLAYTSPAIGHLFPLAPVLLELQRRGHRIHLRTLKDRVELMGSLGFTTEPIDPRIESVRMQDYLAKGAKAALARSADVFAERGDWEAPDLTAAIDQVQPDVVIVDVNSWGAAFAAESWGGPWVSGFRRRVLGRPVGHLRTVHTGTRVDGDPTLRPGAEAPGRPARHRA